MPKSSLTAALRREVATQAIEAFLRELYGSGGSITFARGGLMGGTRLPEGVTAEEMVDQCKTVASAEVTNG